MNSSLPERRPSTADCVDTHELSVLNLDALRDRCLGNDSLMTQILGKLEIALRLECERLSTSWSTCDFAAVTAIAHRLKGTASNVGAEALSHVAAQLESVARHRQTHETSQLILRLENEVGRLTQTMCRNPEL